MRSTPFPFLYGLVLFLFLVVCGLAISGQSFWIDEANSAWKAVQTDWGQFCTAMIEIPSSDTQMPGYMAGLWVWEKVFDQGELALRAFNAPWLLVGCWCFLFYWRVPARLRLAACVCLLISPFTWYYLDEARPYAMQIGAGVLTVCAMHHLMFLGEPRRLAGDIFAFLTGTFLLSASSLFAMVLAFLFYLALMLNALGSLDFRTALIQNKTAWFLVLIFSFPFTALAGYFLWTLGLGARASGVGGTGWLNLPFALYELGGLTGLGPDRNSIRTSLLGAFYSYTLSLGLGLVAYAMFFVCAWKGGRDFRPQWVKPVLVGVVLFLAGCALAFTVGVFGDFRLLGRHLTPLFPLMVMLLAVGLVAAWQTAVGRGVVVFWISVMLISSLNQRFHSRFAKDDYRGAAAMARQALHEGGIVWWAADGAGANFYGVEPVLITASQAAPLEAVVFFANNREADYLAQLPEPAVVILSKEDIYDRTGALRHWIESHGWNVVGRLPGFTVWGAPGG